MWRKGTMKGDGASEDDQEERDEKKSGEWILHSTLKDIKDR